MGSERMNFSTKDIPPYPVDKLSDDLKYIKLQGKSYTWVIREDLDPSTIHVQTNNHSGYGGRTFNFPLTDGTFIEMIGPWNSSSDSLLSDTGFDVTKNHYTFGIIAKDFDRENWIDTTLIDVIYCDINWTKGAFDRIEKLAQKLANENKCRLVFYRKSYGGSMRSFVEPNNEI